MTKIHLTLREIKCMVAIGMILGLACTSYSQVVEVPESAAKKIVEGVYVHEKWGANITISAGEDGLLIVDTGYPGSAEYTDSTIRAGFEKSIKYIVNTHLHFDHVGGNHLLSGRGTVIVAHENTRKRMMKEWKAPEIPEAPDLRFPAIPPYSKEFLPELCFHDSIDIHINNQLIRCIHIPGGHSDCDVVVVFMDKNVIQTGDLFLSNSFPPIELTTKGYLAAVERIIGMCDENTIVIPGHGTVSDRNGLWKYHRMISVASDRINSLKSEGKSLKEVIDSDPLVGLLEGKSYASEELFIYCVYNSGISY